MRKIFSLCLAVVSVPLSMTMVSCAPQEESEFSPRGPSSSKTNMSWNRPEGPEGAGALGILNDR